MRFVSEWICVGQGDISEGKSRLPTCMCLFFLAAGISCSDTLTLFRWQLLKKREQICGCVERGKWENAEQKTCESEKRK